MNAWIRAIENASFSKLKDRVARLERELGHRSSASLPVLPPRPQSQSMSSPSPAPAPSSAQTGTLSPVLASGVVVKSSSADFQDLQNPRKLSSNLSLPVQSDLASGFAVEARGDMAESGIDLLSNVRNSLRPASTKPFQGTLELLVTCSIINAIEALPQQYALAFVVRAHRRPVTRAGERERPVWESIGHTEANELADPHLLKPTLDLTFCTTIPLQEDGSGLFEYLFELSLVEDLDNEQALKPLGGVSCTSDDIVLWRGKSLSLKIRPRSTTVGDSSVQGWIAIQPLEPIAYMTPRVAAPFVVCPQTRVNFESVRRQYAYQNSLDQVVRFDEVLSEAPLLFVAAIQFLDLLIREEKALTREFEDVTFGDPHVENLRKQQASFHLTLVTTYQESMSYLAAFDGRGFRASVMKKEEEVQFLPINCHIHELVVEEVGSSGGVAVYDVVTFGAPAAHQLGFKRGGLITLTQEKVEQGEGGREARGGVLGLTDNVMSFFGGRKRHSLLPPAAGTAASAAASFASQSGTPSLPPARTQRSQLLSTFDLFCNRCEEFLTQVSLPDFESAEAERTLQDLITRLDWILTSARSLPVVDSDEHERLRETITAATLPTFQNASRTVLSGNGADFGLDVLKGSLQSLQSKTQALVFSMSHAFDARVVQEDAASLTSIPLVLRRDLILSQCLVALVTIFTSNLNRQLADETFLNQLAAIGYLVQFESLLSTSGDETGMLEDMYTAMRDLDNVFLRLGKSQTPEKEPLLLEGTRSRIIVTFNLAEEHFQKLPRPLREGRLISVIPCLFTQGINEAQTFANTLGDTGLQEEINSASFETLQKYCQSFRGFRQSVPGLEFATDPTLKIMDDVLQRLGGAIELARRERKKSPSILFLTEEITRRVRGGRLTSCKSAKDRTAMAVTLEETYLLVQNHHVPNLIYSFLCFDANPPPPLPSP